MWRDNAPTLKLFLAARRCWRLAPLGGVIGYDYPNLEARLRMLKTKLTPDTVELLEAMLDAALPVINRKDEA